MKLKKSISGSSRRNFLTKQLPAGALMCLGCKSLLSSPVGVRNLQEAARKAKYLMDSGMSTEEVFRFTYNYCVPIYKKLGEKMGNEKLIQMLKEASAENMTGFIMSMTKGEPGSMKAWAEFIKGFSSKPPYDKAFTYEVVEESDKVFEVKYTECLVAKLYREMNAADIGYAIECSPSEKIAKAFNPKIEVKSLKNTMKGDDVCWERFTFKT